MIHLQIVIIYNNHKLIKTSTKIVGQAILENKDEKTAEKFRKLMGLKSDKSQDDSNKSVDEINKKQQIAFEAMNKEYELARVTTHLNRGYKSIIKSISHIF